MTKQIYSASSIHSILLSWIPDSYIFMLDCQFQPVVNRHLKLSNFQNKTIVSMPNLVCLSSPTTVNGIFTHLVTQAQYLSSIWYFSLAVMKKSFRFTHLYIPWIHSLVFILITAPPVQPLFVFHWEYFRSDNFSFRFKYFFPVINPSYCLQTDYYNTWSYNFPVETKVTLSWVLTHLVEFWLMPVPAILPNFYSFIVLSGRTCIDYKCCL